LLKYLFVVPFVLASCVAFARDGTALCQLTEKYILARTPSGLPQFSNVGNIEIICSVPERPFPTKPGDKPLLGLKVATKAYQILADGSEKLVPSETNVTGGMSGFGPVSPGQEGAIFVLHIPLKASELDAEAKRLWEKISADLPPASYTKEKQQQALERLREFNYQHRLGRFRIECRVMDGTQTLGVGIVQFEIVFKGRFSDLGVPLAPPV